MLKMCIGLSVTVMYNVVLLVFMCGFNFLWQSMLLLAPKLSEKTINNQLLKYFAKLQMDQEVLYKFYCCSLHDVIVISVKLTLRHLYKTKTLARCTVVVQFSSLWSKVNYYCMITH